MAPTAVTKNRKVTSNKKHVLGKPKSGGRRKRAETDSLVKAAPTNAPYKRNDDNEDKQATKAKKTMSAARAAAICDNTDTSVTDSEDEEDDVVGVSNENNNSNTNDPPLAPKHILPVQYSDTIKSLQDSNQKLQSRITMLSRQIKNVSKIGTIDRYEVMQLRKLVKEDLFKRVKFITTAVAEKKCMRYLCNKLNIPTESQPDWCATYAHTVRDALNNKRNNVSQDLKSEIKGKRAGEMNIFKDIRCSANHYYTRYSVSVAILGDPAIEYIKAEAFLDIRNPNNNIQQDYYNLFFDRLLPCVAGKKLWTNKDKMGNTITEGGKISVTDEAFTELCLLNYWEKWTAEKDAQWTDSRGGNSHFKGWSTDAYVKFDEICKRVHAQRTTEASKAMEIIFLDYANEKYGRGTKRNRYLIQEVGIELYDELIEL